MTNVHFSQTTSKMSNTNADNNADTNANARAADADANARANARAAYAKKLLEIDPTISNITLDSIANAEITSHRQLFVFMMTLPLQWHVADPAVQQVMRALASQGFVASIVKCEYHHPLFLSVWSRFFSLVDSSVSVLFFFALLADHLGQETPSALSWMESLGITNLKEWMVNSADESSFTSTDGERRDVPTNKSRVSAQKNQAAQYVIEMQKGLDALYKVIPLYLDAAAFAEVGDKRVARRADDKKKSDDAANTSTVKKQRIREAAALETAALKKKTAAALADLDGDSAASICLAATAAEDDADGMDDRRRDAMYVDVDQQD
jgi:hypothetical protein